MAVSHKIITFKMSLMLYKRQSHHYLHHVMLYIILSPSQLFMSESHEIITFKVVLYKKTKSAVFLLLSLFASFHVQLFRSELHETVMGNIA